MDNAKLKVDGREIEIEGLERTVKGNVILPIPQWEEIGTQEPPEEVAIIIGQQGIPMLGSTRELKAYFERTAKALVDLMVATMPQGLLDYILAELTRHQASAFVVRSAYWDNLIRRVEQNEQNNHPS